MALREFGVKESEVIKLSKRTQITTVYGQLVTRIGNILEDLKPKIVIVQGDTTSAVAGAAAAFFKRIPVAHVEAGLRSGNSERPFPEEVNRQVISRYSKLHFAPTKVARVNLLREGIKDENIFVVGNTIVDTLRRQTSQKQIFTKKSLEDTLLVTLHRRENFEVGIAKVCKALNRFASNNRNVKVLFVRHSNPKTTNEVSKELILGRNVKLIQPTTHLELLRLMINSRCILTDSGGIQEEAFLLNKKILIARTETERPEVLMGDSKLLELNEDEIFRNLEIVFTKKEMNLENQFNGELLNLKSALGNGYASESIMKELRRFLENTLD
jgi:UDP-N-acetylglucosamine 2-epimerase (non-hydrolysing)